MKRATKLLTWIGLAVLVIAAAVVIVIATADWNRLKPMINERASAALDRPFAINGDLSVDWRREAGQRGWRGLLPWVHVTAEDLSIGNPDWASTPMFATFERLRFRLALLPLLWREVVIPHVQVGRPAVWLERLEDGRANWVVERDDKPGAARWKLDIGAIEYDQGRVSVADEIHEGQFEALIDPLGEPIPFRDLIGADDDEVQADEAALPYVFGWQAEGRYRGHDFSGAGNLGGLLALRDARRPFPVHAEVQIGDTHIAVEGTLTNPLDLAAFDLRLRLSGANLAELYSVAGLTLPDTAKYATDGQLSVKLRERGGAVYRYEDFSGRIGGSDILGSLTYTASEPQPTLVGELISELLRFADLAPLIGADVDAPRDEGTEQPPNRVLPAGRFRTERWREMDADVRFTAQHIDRGEHLPFTHLDTHLSLVGGVLRLDPLDFGIAGGNLAGTIVLDGRASPMPGHVHLHARRLALAQLFPGIELMRTSDGEFNGEIDLSGTGNSVGELLGTADGELKLIMSDGVISRGLMELAGLNLGTYIVNELFGDDEEVVNCVIADFNVQQGVMNPRVLLFDTEHTQIEISGTANLADEQLDLEVRPHSKGMRILSLRSPLYVRGTFMAPDAGVQPGPLFARGAGALALGVTVGPLAGLLALIAPRTDEDADPCLPLLQELEGESR